MLGARSAFAALWSVALGCASARSVALGCASAIAVLSCASGAAGKAMRPTSPFTDGDAQLFEDGIDLVGNPDALMGRWADDWADALRERIARADLVARVTVDTLRDEVSPEQRTTHALVASIDEVLKGKFGDSEISLTSSEGSLGFRSVDRERTNALRRPLMLFAKWARDADGVIRPHWHLALPSDAVRAELEQSTAHARTMIEER